MEIKLTNVGFFPKITGTGKTLLKFMMRTFIFLFCAAAFSITPNMVVSQNAKIVVDADKTVSVDEVFDMITKQTEYSFIYPEKLFKDFPKLELKKGTIRATKLLHQILDDADFNVILTQNNTILIKEKTFTLSGAGQQQQVTGKVTDAAGLPVPGVTVLIKGTGKGTATDFDGNYSIAVPNPENVLVFSALGFENYEITVGNQSVINVTLKEAVATLEEVTINAGYYKTTKRLATGSISKVDAKVIEKQPVQNPLQALQGRVPGLEITQSSGMPGSNFRVRIRGTNSIASGNDPLFIVDGIPYTSTPMTFQDTSSQLLIGGTSPLNNINPNDIESIEVLKDADATAIYGSRGSNGVVLITTKKGKIGKTKVGFNSYSGISKMTTKMNLLNTEQYIAMRLEAFDNDNRNPTTSSARDLLVWDTERYTDWKEELIGGNAYVNDAQFSISGGEGNTQYSFGIGYHKETTVLPGDNSDQRISSHLNITNTTPNNKLKTSFTVNYSVGITDLIARDLTGTAMVLAPNAPAMFTDDGELNWDGWDPFGTYINPATYTKQSYDGRTNNLLTSIEIGYMILKNLEIKSRMGYTNISTNTTRLVPISSQHPATIPLENNSIFANSTFENWMIEPQLNWKSNLGKGQLDVLVGTQFLDETTEGVAQYASGFTSEALMEDIASARDILYGTTYYREYRYHAIFGRLNYSYDGKYMLNLTGRRDGSSRFGVGKKFANFGAVGLAWIFSNEEFIKNTWSFLSFGKLRGSYGLIGNDQLQDYEYLDSYTSGSLYQDVVGLAPTRLFNPDFAWETNKKLEFALELGFFKDRVSTSISWYRNRSSNQLVGNPLPPTAGFNSIQANFPATVQNTGLEIEINSLNIQKDNFNWSTSLNVSVPKNKLIAFPDVELFPSYADRYVVGEPLSILKGYKYLGVDPATGVYMFEDVNGDGNFDTDDRQTIKFIGPKFYGGFSNSFKYKGLQFDVFFQFVKQTGRNYINTSGIPGFGFNQPTYVLDRWQEEGDITDIQRYGTRSSTATPQARLQVSDRVVSDASFIRLKNISLSYTIPKIADMRVFIQAQNLLTFTNYKGLDPETQNNVLPPLRTITAGVSVNF